MIMILSKLHTTERKNSTVCEFLKINQGLKVTQPEKKANCKKQNVTASQINKVTTMKGTRKKTNLSNFGNCILNGYYKVKTKRTIH